MRLVYMGTPDFAVPPLERLLLNHHEVRAVYTQPDRSVGRGTRLQPPPVKRAAQKLGLNVEQPESLRDGDVTAKLVSLNPDIIVVAAYGQILPRAVLEVPAYGCINIHPSLLPRHRGASPVAAAILSGDEFTGVSIMLMDEGMDTGAVMAQARIPVAAGDTAGSLTGKLSVIAAAMLPEVLARWQRKEITPRTQDESRATYSGQIKKEDAAIDWGLPALTLWRQVRAYNPWPGSHTRWKGKQLRVLQAVPVAGKENHAAGTVLSPGRGGPAFGVATGEGILGILEVQLEGKRPMTAVDFLRGQRELIGSVLPS